MFCMNCGEKLIEGAKFCPSCGTNIADIMGQGKEKIVLPKTTQDIKKILIPNKESVEDIFSSIFHIKGEFGQRVFIIGRDKTTFEDEIKEHFLSGNVSEKLLMIFRYEKNIGFVVTNQRIVWDYERGLSEIALENIKVVEIGKSGLANIMKLTSYDNEIYPKIYLTGMNKEYDFVIKFRKFIFAIQNKTETMKENTDFIVRSCEGIKFDSLYCEMGSPTIPSTSKKYQKAKLYFKIPDNEDVFFIYDSTVLGSCKTGLAICTSGYYYSLNKNGYIPWKEFVSVDISKCFGGIRIGKEEFTTSTSTEAKKIMMILKGIQEYLR